MTPPGSGGEGLAGESSADSVNSNSICLKTRTSEASYVFVAGDSGPMFCEDTSAEWFDFAEGDCLMACSLEPESKPANPAE
jgi:hypothetical protein